MHLILRIHAARADEGTFLRRYVARHIGKGLALGVPAIGASLATLAASVTARRITAPGPRDKKFVTPWELQVPHEDVIFRTEDGLLLRGWWLPSPEAKRTVIALHGHRGARHHCVGIAAALWRRGANVLLFGHRGRGSSGGKPSPSATSRRWTPPLPSGTHTPAHRMFP